MGPLSERLAALCAEIEPDLGPDAETVRAIRLRLEEPVIRLAVGGRLKAGKSTLVNALLGQRLAATDGTECTRVVAWFRYNHQNRVLVRLRDGTSYPVPSAPGGGLRCDHGLGQTIEDVEWVEVETSNVRLRDRHMIIDTPGLDALSGLDSSSMAALSEADALVYLMPHPGQRDRETLEALRGAMGGSRLSAANAVGVLSRVDQLGYGTGDPWTEAHRIARRYATALRTLVADVVPVVGLLAETALGDHYRESDTRLLHLLARADRASVQGALYGAEDFLGWTGAPMGIDERKRLLALLGVYGLREVLRLIDAGCHGTRSLLDRLRERSGIEALTSQVAAHLAEGADRLRASSALAALDRIVWRDRATREQRRLNLLRSQLDRIRRAPGMRQVEVAAALDDLNAGRFSLDDEDERALVQLVTGRTPAERLGLSASATRAEIATRADQRNNRWRRLAATPSRVLARHATVARELFEALYFDFEEGLA